MLRHTQIATQTDTLLPYTKHVRYQRKFRKCVADPHRICEIAQGRCNRQRGEVTIDDSGNASQHLQYRLHPFTDDGLCILGEIDGAHQAQRTCDGHGDDRADEDGAPEERDGAKSKLLPKAKRRRLRAPLRSAEKTSELQSLMRISN